MEFLEATEAVREAIEKKEKKIEGVRQSILELEKVMLEMKDHQIKIETTHYFAPGVYMRQVFLPKGTTATGMIHKTEHLNILSQGDLSVWTEDGIKRLQASTVVKSQPGTKRVAHAHEDSVWITVHPNPENEKDVQKLEGMLVTNSFEDLVEFVEPRKIEGV